jgi:hypothetical protein
MLWAALASVLVSLAAGAALGIDVTREPQQLAYLFALTLLGSWGALAANKATEGRAIDPGGRRLLDVLVGGLLGVGGLVLAPWLGLTPGGGFPGANRMLVDWVGPLGPNAAPLRFPAYFCLLALLSGGWRSLAARDRKARFRILPLLGTALAAAVLFPVWPSTEPANIATAVSIAAVTQLVSPWNEAAAAYARAQKKRKVA